MADCLTPGRLEVGDTAEWNSALLPELDAAVGGGRGIGANLRKFAPKDSDSVEGAEFGAFPLILHGWQGHERPIVVGATVGSLPISPRRALQ